MEAISGLSLSFRINFLKISLFPGPSLFYSCPMDFKVAEGWFVNVWNYNVIPYLHQTLRSGRKVFQDVSFLYGFCCYF